MRKTFLLLSLVAVTLLVTVNEVSAQRGRGGRGGGRVSVGVGVGRYYGGSYYGRTPYYSGGYYSPGYSYSPGYYYSTPDYVYVDPPADPIYRQSGYADPNVAHITVLVPNTNATIWFDDAPTSQTGMQRYFDTPALQRPGTYTIKARWTDGARTVDQQRTVTVQPGQSLTVDFRGEQLPTPK